MQKLSYKEMLTYSEDYSSLSLEEQVNVNHIDCPAGQDVKKRLYIRRVDNGYVFYCHHCGERGYVADRSYSTVRPQNNIGQNSTNNKLSIPADAETELARWPAEARLWVKQYGITDKEIKDNGIFYSARIGRVGLPSFASSGVRYISYRRVHKQDDGPKYLGKGRATGSLVSSVVPPASAAGTTIIIVEDKLSAIKCARVCDSLCLNGTYLDDESLAQIIDKYTDFYIFLDNDNRDVKMKQLAIKNKLEVFGKVVKMIKHEKQPKELSESEIRSLL